MKTYNVIKICANKEHLNHIIAESPECGFKEVPKDKIIEYIDAQNT